MSCITLNIRRRGRKGNVDFLANTYEQSFFSPITHLSGNVFRLLPGSNF